MLKRMLIIFVFAVITYLGASIRANASAPDQVVHTNQVDLNNDTYLPLLKHTQGPEWIGPDGGLISAIAIDSQNPGVVYAGSWGGGVYKSTDSGVTWKKSSTGLGNLVIVSLAIDPAHQESVYAGTYRGKVFKSNNGGTSWALSSSGIQEQAIVYSIVIEPLNTQRVYAATRGVSNNNSQPWAGVVYRSDDGGGSWFPSLYNLGGAGYQDYVYALEINPNAPQTIFAATHEHGPVRSENYGVTWQVLTNGITNRSTRAIVVDPRVDYKDTVYTGVWTRSGVFKSTDGGDSWTLKSDGINGANIYGMAINPFAPRTLYAATYNMGVVKTTSGANTWFDSGLGQYSIASIRVSPGNGQKIYAGTAGDGFYASSDGGANWNLSQKGISATSVTSLVAGSPGPGDYYAGLEGGGIMRSQDGAQSWAAFNNNLPDRIIRALVKHPAGEFLLALTDSAGLYRCNLGATGTCWQKVNLNIVNASPTEKIPGTAAWDESLDTFLSLYGETGSGEGQAAAQLATALLAIAFAPSDANIAYIGTGGAGVYVTHDGGNSWAPSGWSSQNIRAIAVHPQNPNIVYAASDQSGVIKTSPDGGASWGDITLPGLSIYSLAISPAEPDRLLAGTSSGVYQRFSGSWSQVGLAGQVVTALTVHPGRPDLFVAGTTSGAWISANSGASWHPSPSALGGIKISSISFSPHDPGLVFYNTLANGTLRAGIGY